MLLPLLKIKNIGHNDYFRPNELSLVLFKKPNISIMMYIIVRMICLLSLLNSLSNISKMPLAIRGAVFMSSNQSLCVLRLSALGDCINAFGLIGALKKKYPQLNISWVIDKRFAPLFCDELGRDLIPMYRIDFKGQGLKSLLKLRKELKQEHFDILLNMQTSIKASLCSLVICAQDKYGYDAQRSREGQRFFIDHQVPSPQSRHVLSGFMAFAQACNLPVEKPYWDFNLSDELINKMQGILGSDNVVAISPCSANQSKNWTIEGNVALAQYAQDKGFKVVLIGGGAEIEKQTCAAILQQCPQCLNLCGKTSLRELAALLSICKVVLAPDSGSMHLASALNTPVVGLFARHDDNRVGPWNYMDLNVSVYNTLAQEELHSSNIPWRYRVKQEKAMERIEINDVKAAFDRACNYQHL